MKLLTSLTVPCLMAYMAFYPSQLPKHVSGCRHLVLIRHGGRLDQIRGATAFYNTNTTAPWDSPLDTAWVQRISRCRASKAYLDVVTRAAPFTLVSSPFARTLQTAKLIAGQYENGQRDIPFRVETCVSENFDYIQKHIHKFLRQTRRVRGMRDTIVNKDYAKNVTSWFHTKALATSHCDLEYTNVTSPPRTSCGCDGGQRNNEKCWSKCLMLKDSDVTHQQQTVVVTHAGTARSICYHLTSSRKCVIPLQYMSSFELEKCGTSWTFVKHHEFPHKCART